MSTHIGTSGWSYGHWENVLYPAGTTAGARLGYYCRRVSTVVLNASFYRWPRGSAFAGWRRRLPQGFALSVKAPRGLTHGKRLYAPEAWVGRITESWHQLGDKRAVLLVQLPPGMERDDSRLDYFLPLLPAWIRPAVEFRHPSWHDEAVSALLEHRRAAYCAMSGAGLPCVLRATADFVYVRMHGPDREHLYGGSYPDQDLQWWAGRIREWQAAGKDVFAYFNNDEAGHAVHNAGTLRSILGEG
ncbi:DUF72 domain-containing protein [Arthrobacter deserti]|uniref:DUF72 domain-containing protein n=1 Tax=Arthrobacter deserti TaxID=1742687 RepID=A0ABX1JLC5_9MICC|nr:DUF72 domain-containing protein [Arthrobacter deserti]